MKQYIVLEYLEHQCTKTSHVPIDINTEDTVIFESMQCLEISVANKPEAIDQLNASNSETISSTRRFV